jgi:hypothetical protein
MVRGAQLDAFVASWRPSAELDDDSNRPVVQVSSAFNRDVIAACATHIPLPRIPAHVVVIRHGQRVKSPAGTIRTPTPTTPVATTPSTGQPQTVFLQRGDQIRVSSPGVLRFSYAGNRYRVPHGQLTLVCHKLALGRNTRGPRTGALAVSLRSGRVAAHARRHPRRALVLTPEMLAFATYPNTIFVVDRNPAARRTQARSHDRPIVAARTSDQLLRINTRATYTAISDPNGLRLDVWPFAISRLQRAPTPGEQLPPFWADGRSCSVGCTAPGAIPGWPIRPFHEQHALRSGINELRPANFHVAVDIEASNFQRVYAIQSGYARTSSTGSYGDYKVTVGSFTYWHIVPAVSNGQYVVAYKTVIGAVEHGLGHLAFEEGANNSYLNPLRPGGSLRPYTDTEAPIIGVPRVFADGHVIVGAFDPQSYVQKESYETPVLAPASLAWRLYSSTGRPLTGLEWALRGSGYISPSLKPVIFAPQASNPGFDCFYAQLRCIPNWVYNLAGGLTAPLPLASLPRGRYRLTVYAWDWAGNKSALDDWLTLPLARTATTAGALGAEFGPLNPQFEP